MKNTFRTCDICKIVVLEDNDHKLETSGWSQLRYSFGSTHNAYNALSTIKDLCPECSIKLGLITINDKNPEYPHIPDSHAKISEETDTNLMSHIRDFITQTGEEEGWYKE